MKYIFQSFLKKIKKMAIQTKNLNPILLEDPNKLYKSNILYYIQYIFILHSGKSLPKYGKHILVNIFNTIDIINIPYTIQCL